MLNIYELHGDWYCQTHVGTVVAESEKEAREMVAEYNNDFLDPAKSSCRVVPFEKGVIMTEWIDY